MKKLYARVLLWLIRLAIDAALRDETRQGGVMWRMQHSVSASDGAWTIRKDGSLQINPGARSSSEGQSGRSRAP